MRLQDFLLNQGFHGDSKRRDTKVTLDRSEPRSEDWTSRAVWLNYSSSSPPQAAIQAFADALAQYYPVKVTSFLRPSLTHEYGAVDLALDDDSVRYAHNKGIDPRLYARPDFIKKVSKAMQDIGDRSHLIQVMIEDNHLHVHPRMVGRTMTTLPDVPLVAQLNQRPGYARTADDEVSDTHMFKGVPWVVLSSDVIRNMPVFKQRF